MKSENRNLVVALAVLLMIFGSAFAAMTPGTDRAGENPPDPLQLYPLPTATPTRKTQALASTPAPSVSVQRAIEILQQAKNLETELRAIDTASKTVVNSLAALDKTRPVLGYIDQLKSLEVPLLGNAWDILIKVMDSASPGSGTALARLDSGLRTVLSFKDDLSSVKSLDSLADSVAKFRRSPTSANLDAVNRGIDQNMPGLLSIQSRVKDLFGELDILIDDIQESQRGLASAIGSLNPAIAGLTSQLSAGIDDMLDKAQQTYSDLQDFAVPLNRIITALQAIRSGNDIPPEPSNTGDPADQIVLYWRAVTEKRYQDAWGMLTASFKTRAHNDNFDDYAGFYKEKNYCSVNVKNLKVLEEKTGLTLVYARTIYTWGAGCTKTTEYDFDYEMYKNQATGAYEIERLRTHK